MKNNIFCKQTRESLKQGLCIGNVKDFNNKKVQKKNEEKNRKIRKNKDKILKSQLTSKLNLLVREVWRGK